MNKRERALIVDTMNELRRTLAGEYFRRPSAELAGEELSLAELSALMLISRDGPMPVGVLGAELGRSQTATSRLADRLVRAELLTRTEDANDRRVRVLELAPRGRKVLAAYERQHSEAHARLFEALTPDELDALVRALEILRGALGRIQAAAKTSRGAR
ncbi:MarR family transcriptional regulator [Myxococcota bacterium]|nr:MarR family transcriptional regulator [Myxococcota bacterium]